MKKSIIFYFNSLKPSGGIERVIVTLANKLCQQFNITILVKDEPISFYPLDDRIKLVSLSNELAFNMNNKLSRVFTAAQSVYHNSKLLKSFFVKNRFDYYYLAHPLNVLEFHLSRGVNKADTIITEHGAIDAYNFIYKSIKKMLYPKAKVYIVPTTSDNKEYQELGFPSRYIPHFKSDLPYEIAPLNQNIALSIGRFTAVKQQMVLLRIWNSLVNERKITNWMLLLVGEGELKGKFEEYIVENNLQKFVFLMPPRKDVQYYYKQASLFLLSSESEGFGMVLLEAISFGLPCISFDCPSGPRDIIQNNTNGFLVEHNNEKAFEESLLRFISEPELKTSMAKESFLMSKIWEDETLLQEWHKILD
jgi:glycosyltransferase involved in cell wall biosynthesis